MDLGANKPATTGLGRYSIRFANTLMNRKTESPTQEPGAEAHPADDLTATPSENSNEAQNNLYFMDQIKTMVEVTPRRIDEDCGAAGVPPSLDLCGAYEETASAECSMRYTIPAPARWGSASGDILGHLPLGEFSNPH